MHNAGLLFPCSYYPLHTIDLAVKATFDGTVVRVGKEGRVLYEQSGYGRLDQDGVKLSNQEALYLLHRQKIDVTGYTFNTLFSAFADQANFLRSFLVYRDLRERGYVVQAGPHDFRVFKRGEKPGTGESLYLVRVLSERDPIRFVKLIEEVVASRNMRKQYVLAVVDDEEELTYYEIKLQKLAEPGNYSPEVSAHEALLVGKSAMVLTPAHSDLEQSGFGKRLDVERLMLAPVELLYLMGKGKIVLKKENILSGLMSILHLPARLTENLPRRIRYILNSGGTISLHGLATNSVTISGSTAGKMYIQTCWCMQSKKRRLFL